MKVSLGRGNLCGAIPAWCTIRALLAIVFSIGSAFPLAGQPPGITTYVGQRRVPSIKGQTPQEVQSTLRPLDLEGRKMGFRPSTQYSPGTVSYQFPDENALLPHPGVVQYWLAPATPTPVVPAPASTVPSPPSVAAKVISAAPPVPPVPKSLVAVPYVVGWDIKPGFDEIFNVPLNPQFADGKRSGKITKLDPPAGKHVKSGSSVKVWVSGPPWMVIILCALAATTVVYLLKKIPDLIPPKIKLVPFKDYGEQSITSAGPLLFALKLCPVLDPGNQELEKTGALVATTGG